MHLKIARVLIFCITLVAGLSLSYGTNTGVSVFNQAYAQCTPGPCGGTTECICNGTNGAGAGPCTSTFPCCCQPPPPPETPGCTGGCTFATGACDIVEEQHEDYTRPHFDLELYETGRWYVEDFFAGYLLPSMMGMAEELTAVAMHQVVTIGGFFDASLEISTHRALREFHAQAHKDYHPSSGVCTFATNVRGLAMSDRRIDMTHSILNTRALSRHLGRENDAGAEGIKTDLGEDFTSRVSGTNFRSGRLRQFQDEYCNDLNNNAMMVHLCDRSTLAIDPRRYSQDLDFYDVFASQKTIDINFLTTLAQKTPEEIDNFDDFVALNKNLYGHLVPYRLSPSSLQTPTGSGDTVPPQAREAAMIETLKEMRSLVAKRNVAENSFHAQAAMRSQGDPSASGYMNSILSELGLPSSEIVKYTQGGVSYNAQMEILTKKIYQNPRFFVNLYDKPANVKRKHLSLKAISLMQDWDTFEANLRVEMLAGILLELSLDEAQDRLQRR